MSRFRIVARFMRSGKKRRGGVFVPGAEPIREQSRSISAIVPRAVPAAAADSRAGQRTTDKEKLHRLVPSLLPFQGKLKLAN